MRLFPSDEIPRFQVFCALFLAAILASTFIGTAAFGVTLALFAALCVLMAGRLARGQQKQAYALFFSYALFGAAALAASQAVLSPAQALAVLPFLVLGFLALYVVIKLCVVSWEAECRVLGYSEGYAIVQAEPSVLSVAPAGVIAVKSGPVAKGKRARLVFERKLLGQATKPLRLERLS